MTTGVAAMVLGTFGVGVRFGQAKTAHAHR